MKTWVKICGITRVEDAVAVVEAGADAIGLNFCEVSPRLCSLERAAEITAAVASAIAVYGVFVRMDRARIVEVVRRSGISGVQLHGSENEEEARGWAMPVIRAIGAASNAQVRAALAAAKGYRVLIDNPRGGGSGERFAQHAVAGLDLSEAIVAGGLTPDNVAEVVAVLGPGGVDTAGGVETAPGIKDPRRIREFVSNARSS